MARGVYSVAAAAALWAAAAGVEPMPNARAAEIRLRALCAAGGAVVTLGDVAEVLGADPRQAEHLATIELFPSPAAGTQRFVRLREIQDLLLLRGVNLAEHSFSGASQTTISGAPASRSSAEPVLPQAARRAQQRLRDAIAQYLSRRVSGAGSWNIEFELDAAQVRALASTGQPIAISGGASPWHGRQTFQVTLVGAEAGGGFALQTLITPPPQMVVSTRSLPRGALVRPEDVDLQPVHCRDTAGEYFTSAEEVIGQQTTRALAAGAPVPREAIRQPLLVRRGEVVTVHARGPGLHVRTTARAREDGSLGDLVSVESLHDRKTFWARVCDSREVEVLPRAMKVQDAQGPSADGLQATADPPSPGPLQAGAAVRCRAPDPGGAVWPTGASPRGLAGENIGRSLRYGGRGD